MLKTPEEQLETLTRRVAAAQKAYEEGDIDWDTMRVFPSSVLRPLVAGDYTLPKVDKSVHRVKEMSRFGPETLQRVTISPDGLHAVACAEILREAKEFFLLD